MSTTAVLSSSDFLKFVRQHGVVDEGRLEAFLKRQPEEVSKAEDARALADAMIRERLITQFQSNLLLSGKSKSLRIAGKYRLLDRIGAGGMGLVYLCEHVLMKRLVALKVLPTNLAKEPGNLERFLREAQAVAALKHPNIVQAFDVDSEGGIHYLVMEYIDGVNLDKLVVKNGPLDPVRAAHYVAQAADGLQHAAERGMVHRDIKPSNLLLDRDGTIKVLDMGLARFFDARATNITERFDSNAVIGTADYISPEQALDSKEVDTRADIYSLGCTFYYLLTGKAPFADANVTQKLLLHQLREPQPIKELRPEVDDELIAVIAQMMAKDREHRLQTPAEVVEALAPWTEVPIDRPRAEEMPTSAWSGADKAGTASGVSARTTITTTVPRRGSRSNSGVGSPFFLPGAGEQQEAAPFSWKMLAIKAGVVAVALGVLVLAMVRPWETPDPEAEKNKDRVEAPPAIIKGNTSTPQPAAKAAPKSVQLGAGFTHVKLDPGTPRPEVRPEGIRVLGSDLVLFSGKELTRNTDQERALVDLIRKHLVGGKGGLGTVEMPILPYGIAMAGNSTYPNTLISAGHNNGGLYALALNEKEYVLSKNMAEFRADRNALLRGNLILPPGTLNANGVVMEPRDLAAAVGGSTLKSHAGTILIAGDSTERNFALGSGPNLLTIDFNGRVGFLTLSSSQDFHTQGGGREYVIRARLTNTGPNPVVLSGVSGTIVRLEPNEIAAPSLVIQGATLTVRDKLFRAVFTQDAHLGTPNGLVRLSEASLTYAGLSPIEIDRPLLLQPNSSGQLAIKEKSAGVKWVGKISGSKLVKSGPGPLILANQDNDFTGGVEVHQGVLHLAGESGTPAGRSGVTVRRGARLTGTGKVEGVVHTQAGGVFQPGTEFNRGMQLTEGLKMDEDSTLEFVLPNSGSRLLHYAGKANATLSGVNLRFKFAGNFSPKPADKCFLATSTKPWTGTFRGLAQNAPVSSSDGKWTAKISYTGNAAKNAATGGKDIVLFDFAAAPPADKKN